MARTESPPTSPSAWTEPAASSETHVHAAAMSERALYTPICRMRAVSAASVLAAPLARASAAAAPTTRTLHVPTHAAHHAARMPSRPLVDARAHDWWVDEYQVPTSLTRLPP